MTKNRLYILLAAVVVIIVVVIVAVGFWAGHSRSAGGPAVEADSGQAPSAAVAAVTRRDLAREITIPAEFRPYMEAELNAKVTGYISQLKVDFGDTVKTGQLLAVIEVPELRDQLVNAQATEQKAAADFTNADLIYTRLTAVNRDHPNLVAEQDLDTAAANDHAAAAAIAAARADAEKYQTMINYTRITAPFDGVVTRRYADPGQLIQAGTSADSPGGRAVVRVSDNYLLRLDFPVTVDYVKDIRLGATVQVRVDSLGGKTFVGHIARFTGDVSDSTRTMITEIEVPNPKLEILPGMYATVVLKVEERPNALAIPIEAIADPKTPTVMVLDAQHQIEVRPVQLGLQTPDLYEVISGLHEGDLVIVGNRTLFQAGEKVEPKPSGASSGAAAEQN